MRLHLQVTRSRRAAGVMHVVEQDPEVRLADPSWACTAIEVSPILRPTMRDPVLVRPGDDPGLNGVRRVDVVRADEVTDWGRRACGMSRGREPVGRLIQGALCDPRRCAVHGSTTRTDAVLQSIPQRALWLSAAIVDPASLTNRCCQARPRRRSNSQSAAATSGSSRSMPNAL